MAITEATGASSASTSVSGSLLGVSSTDYPCRGKHQDVEQQGISAGVSNVDPYFLRNALKSEEELATLSRKKSGKRLVKYHRKQNELIVSLLKTMEEHTEEARAEEQVARLPVRIAVQASLAANFVLCVLQLYAAVTSESLSLITTAVDATFDFGSNVVLYWLHHKALSLDLKKWPVGGSRLETIGNIVYGSLSVNLVVFMESIQELIKPNGGSDTFHIPSFIAVAIALGVRFLLFLYCSSLRGQSSQVYVLWEDHRNDIFINGFGLLMFAGGSKLVWWLDPMGAVILSVGVIALCGRTIYQQFELLAGKSAPHEFVQLLTYKAMTFSNEIEQIDTVRAYHSGPEYYVEVDVVMNEHTPLWKAHDISQQLQDKIEVLPNVGRAFVHVDHEATHAPEHRKIQYTDSPLPNAPDIVHSPSDNLINLDV